MSKKDLSEADICDQYITPALYKAGWGKNKNQIRREYGFRDAQGKRSRPDYVLLSPANQAIAVIEAKNNNHSVGGGIQQALAYAEALKVPFVFSSNGDGFLFHDKSGTYAQVEQQLSLDDFPPPDELWQHYKQWQDLQNANQDLLASSSFIEIEGKVLDPACGTGGFFTCAYEHMKKQVNSPEQLERLKRSILGVEKKQLPHLLYVMNLMMHDIEVPTTVLHDNTLRKPLRDYGREDQVDIVVTNPPFGRMEEDGILRGFPTEFQTRETADLFLALVMERLKDGGKAAIVLPDGMLFGEGIKTRIKQKLLRDCNLHTIVRLPNGVFSPYTSIRTNVLFFTKGTPTTEIWYYKHPYPPGVKSYNKTKPMRIEEFEAEKAWWENRQETEFAWKVPAETIIANGYNLDIKNPNAPENIHEDPIMLLRQYQAAAKQADEARLALKAALQAYLEQSAELGS